MDQPFRTSTRTAAPVLLLLAIACSDGNDAAPPGATGSPLPVATEADSAATARLVSTRCPVPGAREIDPQPPAEWRAFRASHPYHIQAVALGAPAADGSRLLVLSEPPPWVCMSALRELAPELRALRLQQWRVGHDGWVRDVTVRLPRLDSLALGLLLQDVHRAVFGTTYKAETLPLRAGTASRPPLDLTVSAAELNRWLVLDRERFSTRGTAPGQPVQELLASGAYGVHFSTVPGLVLWVLPRQADITRYRVDARRWALDSDIVLGAVADAGAVAIVARERTTSTEFLPPLRVETILQLAGASNEHLAQSYERTFVLAGRTHDDVDWAPIYLSPELIDTEYGSLLNITDQMLKSWSQQGQIRYVNFDYPAPGRYPFDQPLSEMLDAREVTFNWNTRGAGYVAEGDRLSIYALNRTGALPVSYFAGDDQSANDATLAAEQVGYGYFASISDPNLARVVQYAALYQLFRAYDVRARVEFPHAATDSRAGLAPLALTALQRFADTDSSVFVQVEDAGLREQLADAHRMVTLLAGTFGRGPLERISARLVRGEGDSDALARDAELAARVAPDGTLNPDASEEDARAYLELIATEQVRPLLNHFVQISEQSEAMQAFEQEVPPPSRPWIHTASIVLSQNIRDHQAVGGHNLDAAVTHFRASPGLAPGEVRVLQENGRRVILAGEQDIARMSGNLRGIAARQDEGALQSHLSALLRRAEAPTIRPRAVALPMPGRQGGRGLIGRRDAFAVGYEPVGRDLTAGERASAEFLATRERVYTGVTRRTDGGYEIVLGGSGEIVRAPNIVSALDVVASQPRAAGLRQYQLYGFNDLDAAAFSRDIELTMRRRGRGDPDRVASVLMRTGSDERAALEAATRNLDFQRARVKAVRETDVMLDGRRHRAYEVDVEITVRAARQPLLIRIWIVFKEGITPAMDAIRVRLASILEALGGDVPADAAAAIIRTELKKSFGSIEHVKTEFDDIVLAYAPPRDSHGSHRDHATG